MNIGYIGLGLMGKPCASNLLKAGNRVFVWARRPESASELLSQGAQWRDSIADVAGQCEILFLNLTNTADVEAVIFGPKGVVEGGGQGLTIVDMSTISATATRDMAKRLEPYGIELVDAPVSGGTAGAANATLTIMVGAREETFKRIQPVLQNMGKNITRIGGCGAGQVAKSCNQIVITGTIAAVAEAFKFAGAAGVDPAPVREALLGGFASSRILEMHGNRMIEDKYEPGFKTTLHLKDMGLVREMAESLGLALPMSQLGIDLLEQTVRAGYGDKDSSAIFKITQ